VTPQAGPPESTRAPKPLSARRYAISIAWRLALFVALILGFPLVTYAVVRLSNCRSVGGACEAVALLSGIYLKPLIILLIAAATNAYAGPLAILAALVLILLAWHARRQAARPA